MILFRKPTLPAFHGSGLSLAPGVLALVALALAGCSQATLTLQPGVLSGCASSHGKAVDVAWDATGSGTRSVKIFLHRPGQGLKLWTGNKAKDHKKTGNWASDGLTFVLQDDTGRELARRTIVTTPCPVKQKDE